MNLFKMFPICPRTSDFDVKIKVGENPNIKEFKAHSIILSARSDYFKAALSSRWARKINGIIIFKKPNISPPVFEILLNYIYTGTFSNNTEVSLLDIFIAADEIGLVEISQQVEDCLLKTVSAWKFPRDFITISKYDTFTNLHVTALNFVRNEVLGYVKQGKFLSCGSNEINELSKVISKNTTVTSLNLSNIRLGSINVNFITNFFKRAGVKILADALCKNSMLTCLDLSKNNLGSEEGKALAGALCKNSTLTSLNLGNNKLGSEGGKALADALCKNSTLTYLNLYDNNVGSEGGKALAGALCKNSTLTYLNLYNNDFRSEGGKALANALCKNSTLTYLNLYDNNLGSHGVKALADALCKNSTLTSLDLGYLEYYNFLGFVWTEEGKALADALCKNSTLTSLSLYCYSFGSEEGKSLVDILCKNSSLTSLKLYCYILSSEGGKAFADALYMNSTLTSLNLKNNYLGLRKLTCELYRNSTLTNVNILISQVRSNKSKSNKSKSLFARY
ncbi:hypothetical protein C2G38_2153070 [Gigaspora rosea]|uniref:BTB domain-containing protein n=1 Tax=Gigaspora rosea TaxID=44941 RepID=A0A397W6E5_9GLOM|nr:hypothetical protein C2G38_2153070 [Gigaspora rosea]